MIIDEFLNELKRVENFYNKEYNEVQKQEMFKFFSNTTTARFKFILSKVYQKCAYLPNLSQLVEIQKNTPHFQLQKEKKQQKEKCNICSGNGFILYTKKDENKGYPYIFVSHCECPASYNFRFDGRKIKDDKCKSNYYFKAYKDVLQEKKLQYTRK